MVRYRLILNIGYCNVSFIYNDIEELDIMVRNILARKENGEDKVKLNIEAVLDDENDKEV